MVRSLVLTPFFIYYKLLLVFLKTLSIFNGLKLTRCFLITPKGLCTIGNVMVLASFISWQLFCSSVLTRAINIAFIIWILLRLNCKSCQKVYVKAPPSWINKKTIRLKKAFFSHKNSLFPGKARIAIINLLCYIGCILGIISVLVIIHLKKG